MTTENKEKRTRRAVTPKDVQKWQKMVASGKTIREVAEASGRNPSVISSHIKVSDVRNGDKGPSKAQKPARKKTMPHMRLNKERLTQAVELLRAAFGEGTRAVQIDLTTGKIQVERTEEFSL